MERMLSSLQDCSRGPSDFIKETNIWQLILFISSQMILSQCLACYTLEIMLVVKSPKALDKVQEAENLRIQC